MGEAQVSLFRPSYNRAVAVVASPTPLTEDAGALLLREASRVLGLDSLLAGLPDHRDPALVTYSMSELVRARVLLLAQGWGDQGDADTLRFDPALRAAVSDRSGEAPLAPDSHLASQPTLSRVQHALSDADGTRALECVLRTVGLGRLRSAEPRRGRLVLDIDTLPIEVWGHQEGSGYNAHYGVTCFQPLVVFADTGDLLAVHLRPSANPTAKEAEDFLSPVLADAKRAGFSVCVRMDAGFANGHLMRCLDGKRVRFVIRLRTTRALRERTDEWFTATTRAWAESRDPEAPGRTATHEVWERTEKGGRVRRILAVAVEPAPGELLPRRFFLCTNFARKEGGSAVLLALYRQRGTAEGHIGEFVRETVPSLRAVPRGRTPNTVGIRDNNVALLFAALAYELLHHLRRGVERTQREGCSLRRLRERVLKVATSVVRHARQCVFRICPTKAALWEALARAIAPPAQLALEGSR